MELLHSVVGPASTNVYVLGDEASREAIAIDTARPCVPWITERLLARGWTLKLIVSTHGHWDHIGDNAALQAWTAEQVGRLATQRAGNLGANPALGGHHDAKLAADIGDHQRGGLSALSGAGNPPHAAQIAVHPLDRERLIHPQQLFAPFDIPPSVPAVDLAEGGRIRFGSIDLEVLHTPGHTEGSVCLFAREAGLLLSGDTLFAGGWGRVDLPGGSPEQMVQSIGRLRRLDSGLRVLPGHGRTTTIGREQAWMDLVAEQGRLFA